MPKIISVNFMPFISFHISRNSSNKRYLADDFNKIKLYIYVSFNNII